MGGQLFEKYKNYTEKADQILGYSIKELCLTDPQRLLNNTKYAQPAMFAVNALNYLQKLEDTGSKPDFLAGHSLGEYCALFAAGAVGFEDGLRLVKKRGELMGELSGGGMAAIIGLTDLRIEQVIRENDLKNIAIANYNTPSQFVVAGPTEDLNKAKSLFEDAGALLYIPLNVSGAFHTLHMKPVQDEFEKYIEKFDFSDIGVPVIANVTGEPYRNDEIKKNLVSQIAKPVQWISSIRYLMSIENMRFEETGPGNVLTNLVKKNLSETQKRDADERYRN